MVDKKTILVFGATGNQGESVINAILRDPKLAAEWNIRAVTRDVTKPSAKALSKQGIEIVTANMDDKASLRTALKGVHSVFLVTNYWETLKADVEIQQGKNVADVAKEVGIQHLIFSSLLNISKISNGKYPNVLHFDGKAEIEDYIRSLGIPATFYQPGIYMSNFIPTASFRPNPETGKWTIALPNPVNKPIMPVIDIKADTGKFVTGIIRNREKVLGKQIHAAHSYYSAEQLVKEFAEVKPEAGKGAVAVQIPNEVFKGILGQSGLPEFVHQEMLENFLLLDGPGYFNGASLEESQSILSEPLTSFKEFVTNDEAFADVK